MSEAVPIWPNFMWMCGKCVNRYDFQQARWLILSNVKLNLILILVNFSCELEQIMTRSDFLYDKLWF